jgi:hypothetical protein
MAGVCSAAAMMQQFHKPSAVCNRQTSWRLRIATVVFLSSAALALQCHKTNNKLLDCETNQNIRSFELSREKADLNLAPKLNSNSVRGLIRTIRVALPPDRDSFQISPSDGSNQVERNITKYSGTPFTNKLV